MKKYLSIFGVYLLSSLLLQAQSYLSHTSHGNGGIGDRIQEYNGHYYQRLIVPGPIMVGVEGKQQALDLTATNRDNQLAIVKYDLDWNIIWTKVLSQSNDISPRLTPIAFGGDVMVFDYFYRNGSEGAQFHTLYALDLEDPDEGYVVSTYNCGGDLDEVVIDISPEGRIAMAASFRKDISIEYFNGQTVFNQTGNQDVFITTFLADRTLESIKHIRRGTGYPGLNQRKVHTMKYDSNEALTLYGYFEGSVELDDYDPLLVGSGTSGSHGFKVVLESSGNVSNFDKTQERLPSGGGRAIQVGENYLVKADYKMTVLDSQFEIVSVENDGIPLGIAEIKELALAEQVLYYNHTNSNYTVDGVTTQLSTLGLLISAYDSDGTVLWAQHLGGDIVEKTTHSIVPMGGDTIGLTLTNAAAMDVDFSRDHVIVDPGTHLIEYWLDCTTLRLSLASYKDIDCVSDGSAQVRTSGAGQGGLLQWIHNGSSEATQSFTDPGVYEVQVLADDGCSKSIYVPIAGPSEFVNPEGNIKSGPWRSGFDTQINVRFANRSCIPIGGILEVTLPQEISFISASASPSTVNGSVLEFVYNDVEYGGDLHLDIDANVAATAQFGTNLCVKLRVLDEGGFEYGSSFYCQEVINSYDPNDIQVFPSGRCEENYFRSFERLEYLIRFQNLGNAEALKVLIVDTLDQSHDINSITLIDASHDFVAYVEQDSILIIEFEDINLPAAEQDEVGSNGYVRFYINVEPELNVGTEVENQASIYFDFNLPIHTNMVTSHLVEELPDCFTSTTEEALIGLGVFPTLATNLVNIKNEEALDLRYTLVDLQGKQVATGVLSEKLSQIQLPRVPGLYMLQLVDTQTNKAEVYRILKL